MCSADYPSHTHYVPGVCHLDNMSTEQIKQEYGMRIIPEWESDDAPEQVLVYVLSSLTSWGHGTAIANTWGTFSSYAKAEAYQELAKAKARELGEWHYNWQIFEEPLDPTFND